eukprot:Nk52_evm7s358 gene=Nk52_evmTU7s358
MYSNNPEGEEEQQRLLSSKSTAPPPPPSSSSNGYGTGSNIQEHPQHYYTSGYNVLTASTNPPPPYDPKWGQPHQFDPQWTGPVEKRQCKDVFFLILFVVFGVIGMGVIAGYGFMHGDPLRLVLPQDSYGNICGRNNSVYGKHLPDFTEMKSLLYFNGEGNGTKICVRKCTNRTESASLDNMVCDYDVDTSLITSVDLLYKQIRAGKCAAGTFNSTSKLRKCIPRDSAASVVDPSRFGRAVLARDVIRRAFGSATMYGMGRDILLDLSRSYHYMLMCLLAAVVVSFLWLWLMQRSVRVMVWFTVGAFVGLSCASTVYFFWQWREEAHDVDVHGTGSRGNAKVMFWFSVVLAVFTLTVLFVLLMVRGKIRIAIDIVQEAATAIDWIPQLTFFPFLVFVVLLLYAGYALTVLVYLATTGEMEVDKVVGGNGGHRSRLVFNHTAMWMVVYHLVGSVFIVNLILAIQRTTIAGCIAAWFFASNKLLMPTSPVLTSLSRVLRYHLGSLVLGSVIITFVQMIRMCFDLVKACGRLVCGGDDNNSLTSVSTVADPVTAAGTAAASAILGSSNSSSSNSSCWSCSCLCGWAETLLRSINKNAYIEVAIYGHSFFHSARVALRLLARNAIRMIATEYIGDFILFLGKTAVTVMVGAIAMELLNDDSLQLRYYAVLVALVMLMAYIIASSFMSVFAVSIATIFICFCEDVERNDGTPQRPYFMTPTLAKAMEFDKEQSIDM